MIKKLYECGCFRYEEFILTHLKELSLTSDEAILLILILKEYAERKTLSSEHLQGQTSLVKNKVDKALTSLLERGFYEIYIHYEEGKGQEYISLDGFFQKVEDILNHRPHSNEDELVSVNQFLTKAMNRILTSKELEITASLVMEDHYSYEDIQKATEKIKQNGRLLTMKSLAQALVEKDSVQTAPTPKVLKDFFESIK